ncbi:DUF3325 domain-containing protein [Alcaligenes nematophilus]|uniref:DUF3325 domain-containing protein n=1 Tax=Alcaligenes nematophilus TaxID=2994643 RepID=A0ABU3MZ29_9BURK|nr:MULTISPECIES: DUF3325 domain-containing protein [Alcaligenes]KVX05177.1 hypothetical protein ASL22_18530 [Alcaligenes faecalis]MDT8464042.1 DUF3325 domain-containing protein [Alcaligenes nematophilus]MDT8468399.1 DUF3325 domain-containing protein [Alcaligenes nematophilus]MDT8505629.1 DUF3325 domain-containing protein [Alcaligenes nematophilus]MDT8524518.1 DUF3325 domain-containing protein [Alcaligenes nematophilus]
MINTSLWLNLAVFIISLAGFICLALASDRQGEFLLHRTPSEKERRIFRLLGWPLLAVALALCWQGWGWSIGTVAWLGWLTMAGAGLTFYLPWWPWQEKKPVRAKPAPVAKAAPKAVGADNTASTSSDAVAGKNGVAAANSSAASTSAGATCTEPTHAGTAPTTSRFSTRSLVFVSGLLAIPAAFMIYLAQQGPEPVFGNHAQQGQIGPWSFALAETDDKAPISGPTGAHRKAFQIRFCQACDPHIRRAYLQVSKPEPMPAPRQAFSNTRWTRAVEIVIPPNSELEHQLWLTVEAKSGEIYHQAFDFHQVSPMTAAFIQQQP